MLATLAQERGHTASSSERRLKKIDEPAVCASILDLDQHGCVIAHIVFVFIKHKFDVAERNALSKSPASNVADIWSGLSTLHIDIRGRSVEAAVAIFDLEQKTVERRVNNRN